MALVFLPDNNDEIKANGRIRPWLAIPYYKLTLGTMYSGELNINSIKLNSGKNTIKKTKQEFSSLSKYPACIYAKSTC